MNRHRRPRPWRAELACQFRRATGTSLLLAGLLLLSGLA